MELELRNALPQRQFDNSTLSEDQPSFDESYPPLIQIIHQPFHIDQLQTPTFLVRSKRVRDKPYMENNQLIR